MPSSVVILNVKSEEQKFPNDESLLSWVFSSKSHFGIHYELYIFESKERWIHEGMMEVAFRCI